MQVAVKSFNIAGASAVAEVDFAKEVHIAQLASATCQRACRILGCCKLNGSPCLVMSLYSSSAAKRLETLQGIGNIEQQHARVCGKTIMLIKSQAKTMCRVIDSDVLLFDNGHPWTRWEMRKS